MIKFLLKGLIRDRSRSLFPILITASGVALTVLALAWIKGVLNDSIETTARLQSGHVAVQTTAMLDRKYPNIIELGLLDLAKWTETLNSEFPEVYWQPRIQFGGLLDIPGPGGETVSQAPVVGMAADLFTPDTPEIDNLNLKKALVKGAIPSRPGEIMLSDDLFKKLKLQLGQKSTLISSDMNGSMAFYNFKIVGTVAFGIQMLDRGALIADLSDAQDALSMIDASSVMLGFFKSGFYNSEKAKSMTAVFNSQHRVIGDDFSPVMASLEGQGGLGEMFTMIDSVLSVVISIFVFIVSIVLWNTGLMNGIRRYGEFGVRLAIGESKKQLYLSLVLESLMIGMIAFVLGTILGLIPSYYLQEYGFDTGNMMQNSTFMMSSVMRAHITPTIYWIGIIPGIVSPVIGSLISGLGLFKRDTSQLFNELEV